MDRITEEVSGLVFWRDNTPYDRLIVQGNAHIPQYFWDYTFLEIGEAPPPDLTPRKLERGDFGIFNLIRPLRGDRHPA